MIPDRKAIEWTPNVITTTTTIKRDIATIKLNSNTPNLKTYQMKELPGSDWKNISDSINVELKKDRNEILFRAVNLAEVAGPEHKIIIAN